MSVSVSRSWLFVAVIVCVLCAHPVAAFGAGSIPIDNEFKGYLWRHGDITDVLKYLPVSFITNYQFTRLQRKQIYFGNWLRDFSQVIDTTCLENLPEALLRGVISVLAFMEFGFATDEFDVTRERLGCYSHVEHIDNPCGYQDDAKSVDKRLRGPVDPQELEIDRETGMKNYIANSGQGWDTSADYIRRQLTECIELGRRGNRGDANAKKECFILLGAALHTLEDFSAHSNYTELVLNNLGENDIFAFVGDACRVDTPRGERVAPITTGTFGMLDIFQSLLGEADDMAVLQARGGFGRLEHLSYGKLAFNQIFDLIKTAVEAIGDFAQDKLTVLSQLQVVKMIIEKAEKSEQTDDSTTHNISGKISDNSTVLWNVIEPLFYIHDRVAKWLQEEDPDADDDSISMNSVESTGGKLGEYSDELIFRFLALFIESTAKEWRNAVRAAKEKVDAEAAESTSAKIYPLESDASDPSHSDLSKDHYSHVLNRPAGLVATVTTNWTTQQIVRCWDDESLSADDTIDSILSILHHPAFATSKTDIQEYMYQTVEKWWSSHTDEEKEKLRGHLSKDSVQNRGHEDHDMTLKDFSGKTRGYAEFPGSRPPLKKPPRSRPVFDSVKGEVVKDVNTAVQLANDGLGDPVGSVTGAVSGVTDFAWHAIRTAVRLPWYAVQAVGRTFNWVLRRGKQRAKSRQHS